MTSPEPSSTSLPFPWMVFLYTLSPHRLLLFQKRLKKAAAKSPAQGQYPKKWKTMRGFKQSQERETTEEKPVGSLILSSVFSDFTYEEMTRFQHLSLNPPTFSKTGRTVIVKVVCLVQTSCHTRRHLVVRNRWFWASKFD